MRPARTAREDACRSVQGRSGRHGPRPARTGDRSLRLHERVMDDGDDHAGRQSLPDRRRRQLGNGDQDQKQPDLARRAEPEIRVREKWAGFSLPPMRSLRDRVSELTPKVDPLLGPRLWDFAICDVPGLGGTLSKLRGYRSTI